MKRLLVVFCVLFLFCASVQADVESFDNGWLEYKEGGGTATIDPNGTILNLSASSNSGLYMWADYALESPRGFGALAVFNVSSSSSNSAGAFIGLREYVAYTTSGTRILAEIYLQDWQGNKTLRYRVREREADSSTTIRNIAQGAFGEWSDMWGYDEDVELSIWMKNDTIYFSCDKPVNQIETVKLYNIASELQASPYIYAYAEADSSIDGTVKDFQLINNSLRVPHITSNATWTDYIQADNNSTQDASFTLVLYDASGNQVYSGSHDVSANSELVILPKTLSSDARLGEIDCTNHQVLFRYSYENDNGGVAEFKLTDEAYRSTGFYFNSTASIVDWKGLAITNSGGSSASVILYAYGNGTLLGTATDSIPANGKILGVHTKWFPEIEMADLDRIIVVSPDGGLIGGIVICGNATNSNLLFTSGSSATGFVPPTL